MTCPTITALHAILAAYDAPAGPSKADTLKAVAECLSGACEPAAVRYYIGSEANAELIERGAVPCAITKLSISRDDVPLYTQPAAAQLLLIALQKVVDYYGYAEFGPIADARTAIAEYKNQTIAQPVAAQGEQDGITLNAAYAQELRALIANLAAVIRVQNGIMHKDANSLMAHADKAIAILAAKGGSV